EEEVLARAQERDGRIAPADAALLLAQAKAEAVDLAVRRVRDEDAAARADGDPPIVLGCDSVLELDGEAYGKPSDAAVATARWRRMRGRSGVLHTGHWVVRGPRMSGATSSTVVHFADVTDAEIEAYVATGEPLA